MSDHPEISREAWLARLGELSIRQGSHLESLRSRDARDFELVLASAALFLPAGQLLDERRANEALLGFLASAGAWLAIDYAELRRWLADTGFVLRSDYGTAYRRGHFPAWLAAAAAQLQVNDLAEAVAQAGEARARQRAQRREAWLAQATAGLEVSEQDIGVQVVFVVDSNNAFKARDANGVTRLQFVQQALRAFAQSAPGMAAASTSSSASLN